MDQNFPPEFFGHFANVLFASPQIFSNTAFLAHGRFVNEVCLNDRDPNLITKSN